MKPLHKTLCARNLTQPNVIYARPIQPNLAHLHRNKTTGRIFAKFRIYVMPPGKKLDIHVS